ncbi:hypothetical protein CLV51_102884 [Chitinophaga niastensis]|uniref:Uncharacterized protein n=1 Tax=Chitinophaga niastensis TaxID=536980 RepID=A0A2P8HP78_CHINA|nr:class I lanthipeptide [Chitinophaga niastensis]PSL48024.1 hypothetical protein CLV51_102884 [Chitinophaga niastensis]
MRKRKMPLEKKLSLNKETIAALNTQQQAAIAGGLQLFTRRFPCEYTLYETCATIPPHQQACVAC